jgi:hypothetical protein
MVVKKPGEEMEKREKGGLEIRKFLSVGNETPTVRFSNGGSKIKKKSENPKKESIRRTRKLISDQANTGVDNKGS